MGGKRPSGAHRTIPLATAVHHMLLPTPNASDGSGAATGCLCAQCGHKQRLHCDKIRRCTKPCECLGFDDGDAGRKVANGAVALLPTPSTHDKTGARSPESIARMDKPFVNLNDTAVNELLSTPQARDSRGVPREDYNQACLPRDIIECDTTWGKYEPAIRRWERLTRPAPKPTEPGVSGLKRPRLNPQFSEWMMGWPLGWITSIGLTRKQQLQIIGNGVVPQQACYALRWLLKISQATKI